MESYPINPVFTRELIEWYHQNHRDLPWRHTRDPYLIWLSEIILQQTRVRQGLPYYIRFVDTYPNVQALAHATEQDVLRLWQGLGYYSRARNLHKCAQVVAQDLGGEFPTSYQQLVKLPGIGDYTASAIASFAFNESEPVVDGNVFRVLARIFGVSLDIGKPQTRKTFKALSANHQIQADPALYNQAVMEFGALQCIPKAPDCTNCVMSEFCFARQNGLQDQLPVKSAQVKVRDRHIEYYLVRFQDRILMRQRVAQDIWQGLYDFLSFEPDQDPADLPPHPHMTVGEPSVIYKHRLSHQLIHARFREVVLKSKAHLDEFKSRYQLSEFEVQDLHLLPKPILIHNYLKATIF